MAKNDKKKSVNGVVWGKGGDGSLSGAQGERRFSGVLPEIYPR